MARTLPTARTIVFDVNDTLTDQNIFADRLQDVGAPSLLAKAWHAATLRDGFALTMVGAAAAYKDVARAALVGLLSGVETLSLHGRSVTMDEATDHVMGGFDTIGPHPDVVDGLRALAASGHQLVTLSNGATAVATGMLHRYSIADCVTQTLSVEDVGAWKPDRRAYDHAAERTGTPARDLLMVAVHPWDLDGAARAGLQTVFLDRNHTPWPHVFSPPDLVVHSLTELDAVLRSRSTR